MEEPFDFSQVPYSFGLCAAKDCPQATTCLRHIALKHAPTKRIFLPIMNPNRLESLKKEHCDQYCSNEKIRFAKGFMRTVNALTVSVADSFRYRMISLFGRKNYYLKRKGALTITPAEQRKVVAVAKELGVVLADYFDGYVEEYNWKD